MKRLFPSAAFRSPPPALAPAIRRGLLVLALGLSACHRAGPAHPARGSRQETPGPGKSAPPDFAVDAVATHEGTAFWYDVPAQSLPQRRAWAGELTAASDTLPLDSYARVSRLDGQAPSDKGVVVRITDTGIQHKGGLIDLNRDAAEALGIIKTGEVRVKVETLAFKNATTDKPVDKKDEPVAPKVSELKGRPAADPQTEKDDANAKTGGGSAP